MANSLYLVQMDIPVELEADFNRIYNDQHIPAILAVPGVVSCKRYRLERSDVAGVPRYLAAYEVASPDIPGNPAWAGTIASVEALTKIALFYFHERAWTRTGWGLSGGQHARAVVKGLSWRALATLDTFGLSWLVTGHLASAAGIATLETFTKVGLFYLHEQAWLRVERVLRGRAPAPAAGTQTLERAKEPHAAGGADSRGADARAGAG